MHDGLVGVTGRGRSIAAQALQQSGRKARYLLHVAVGRHARRTVGFVCRCNDLSSAIFEQRFHAAQGLLQRAALGQCAADDRAQASDTGHNRPFDTRGEHAAQLAACAAGLPAQGGSDRALDTLGRGHDLHIGAGHGVVIGHQVLTPSKIARRAASKSSPEA